MVSLLPVIKADDQLIKTWISEIDRIVLEDFINFKEEHSEESTSNFIQMDLLEIRKQKKRKRF